MLSLTQPEAIKTIHGKYFEAGADTLEINTFSGTTIAVADYQMEYLVYELNYQSAKMVKEVAHEFIEKEPHKSCFVAVKKVVLAFAIEQFKKVIGCWSASFVL